MMLSGSANRLSRGVYVNSHSTGRSMLRRNASAAESTPARSTRRTLIPAICLPGVAPLRLRKTVW